MTSYTTLLFRDEARAKLLAGAEALADAVRPTLGPESRSVLMTQATMVEVEETDATPTPAPQMF